MSRFFSVLSVFVVWSFCATPEACAADLIIGKGTRYPTLAAGIAASERGDVLTLRAGTYFVNDVRIPHDLTLLGEGAVTLTARTQIAKGLLVPQANTNIIVRNMTFQGARSPDKNGAGIRFEGLTLIVEQCTFLQNDNGILATGDAQGGLTVRYSLFAQNGHGDGYSHGIYQSKGTRIEIEGSVFKATDEGHHLKTLASQIWVRNNTFDDQDAPTSYVLDMTAGGTAFIEGNTITRRAGASQDNIFNYDISRGGTLGSIVLKNNQITTYKRRVRLLRNPENTPVTDEGNVLSTVGRGSYREARQLPAQAEPFVATQPDVIVHQSPLPQNAQLAALTPAQRRAVRKLVGQATSATQSEASSEPAPVVRQNAGLLYAPRFAPLPAQGVARFKVRRVLPDGHGFLTFGQMFEIGALTPTQSVYAKLGEQEIATQLDVKAIHQDGSVRHAVVTLVLPNTIAPKTIGSVREGVLLRRMNVMPRDVARAAATTQLPNWTMTISGQLGASKATEYNLPLSRFADAEVWLQGDLVKEVSARAQAGPLLSVMSDIRLYRDGSGRVQFTFENVKTYSSAPRDLAYRVVVRDAGAVLFDENIPLHYRNSAWTISLPMKSPAALDVVHDPEALINSAALPMLDLTQAINPQSILQNTTKVRLGIHAPITPYMPTTGGREDIGPLTAWTAAWVITQDQAAKAVMLRAARIGLTIPWHFAEDSTGLPIRMDQRHNFWADERGAQENFAPDAFPAILFAGQSGGWAPDTSHKPSLAYPAYLATGDQVFLRALRFEASYAVQAVWPELRDGRMMLTRDLQLRATAWGLRSVANAAFILPDDDPFKDYMIAVRDANLNDLRAEYLDGRIMADAGETEGYLGIGSGRDPNAISPWQNDFLAIILSQEVRRDTPTAKPILDWMTNYIAGRVLASGGDLDVVAGQRETVISPNGARLDQWQDVFTATQRYHPENIYIGSADGGYGILRASLGAIISATGDLRAVQALSQLKDAPDADKLDDPANQLGQAWSAQFTAAAEARP